MLKNDCDPLPIFYCETGNGLRSFFFNTTRLGEPCGGVHEAPCIPRRPALVSVSRLKSLPVTWGIMSLPSPSPRPLKGEETASQFENLCCNVFILCLCLLSYGFQSGSLIFLSIQGFPLHVQACYALHWYLHLGCSHQLPFQIPGS